LFFNHSHNPKSRLSQLADAFRAGGYYHVIGGIQWAFARRHQAMNASIEEDFFKTSKSSASWRRTIAQALLLTGTLLVMVGVAALWSASTHPVFAGTPSHTTTGTSQNSSGPTAPNCSTP
jgi:hypothetical protein